MKQFRLVGRTIDNKLVLFNTRTMSIKAYRADNVLYLSDIFGFDENNNIIHRKDVNYPIFSEDGFLVNEGDMYKMVLLGYLDIDSGCVYFIFVNGRVECLRVVDVMRYIDMGYKAVNFIIRDVGGYNTITVIRGKLSDCVIKSGNGYYINYVLSKIPNISYEISDNNINIMVLGSCNTLEIPIDFKVGRLFIYAVKGVLINKLIINVSSNGSIETLKISNIQFIKGKIEFNNCNTCDFSVDNLINLPIIHNITGRANTVVSQLDGSTIYFNKNIADKFINIEVLGLQLDSEYDEILVNTNSSTIQTLTLFSKGDLNIYKLALSGDMNIVVRSPGLITHVIDIKGLVGKLDIRSNYVLSDIIRYSKNEFNNKELYRSLKLLNLDVVVVPNGVKIEPLVLLDRTLIISHYKIDNANNIVVKNDSEEEEFLNKLVVSMESYNKLLSKIKLLNIKLEDEYDSVLIKRNIDKIFNITKMLTDIQYLDNIKLDLSKFNLDRQVDDINNSSDELAVKFKLISNAITCNYENIGMPKVLDGMNIKGIEIIKVKLYNTYSIIEFNYWDYCILQILINDVVVYTAAVDISTANKFKSFKLSNVGFIIKNYVSMMNYNLGIYKIDGYTINNGLGSNLLVEFLDSSIILQNRNITYFYNLPTGKYFKELHEGDNIVYKVVNNNKEIEDLKKVLQHSESLIVNRLMELKVEDVYNYKDASELLILKMYANEDNFINSILPMLKYYYKYVDNIEFISIFNEGIEVNRYEIKPDYIIVEYKIDTVTHPRFTIKYKVVVYEEKVSVKSRIGQYYSDKSLLENYEDLKKLDIGNTGVELVADDTLYNLEFIRSNFIPLVSTAYMVGDPMYGHSAVRVSAFIGKKDGRGYIIMVMCSKGNGVQCKIQMRFNSIGKMLKFCYEDDIDIDMSQIYQDIRDRKVHIFNKDYRSLIYEYDIIGY